MLPYSIAIARVVKSEANDALKRIIYSAAAKKQQAGCSNNRNDNYLSLRNLVKEVVKESSIY